MKNPLTAREIAAHLKYLASLRRVIAAEADAIAPGVGLGKAEPEDGNVRREVAFRLREAMYSVDTAYAALLPEKHLED